MSLRVTELRQLSMGVGSLATLVVLVIAAAAISSVNYLLFHSLVELFSVVVACVIGAVAWYAFRYAHNNFLIFLGIAFPSIALIDLVHTLAYRGMGVFAVDANPATQLWIAARALEAGALLLAPAYLDRALHPLRTLLGFLAAAVLALLLVWLGLFPTMYVEGQGLTATKVVSEYLIIALLALASWRVWQRRAKIDPGIRRLMTGALALTMLSELAFTFYVDVYDLSNMVGHLAKLVAFWLIFIALVRTGLQEPFRILSRNSSTYDAIPEEIVVVDRAGLIRQANRVVERRLAGQSYLGRPAHAFFHGGGDAAGCPVCAAIAAGREGDFEQALPDGRWQLLTLAAIHGSPARQGMVQTGRDLTEIKRTQVELQHLNRALRAISASNRSLIEASSEAKLIADVCRICVEQGGYRMAWVGFADEGAERRIVPVAWAGAEDGYLSQLRFSWGDNPWGQGPAGVALRKGQPRVVNDVAADPTFAPWREAAQARGYAATMAFPLHGRDGHMLGVLAIYSGEANSFTDEEIHILEELSGDLAYGIEALRAGSARDAAESQAEHWQRSLAGVLRETVAAVSGMVEMRDPYTAGHQRRVAQLAAAIGRELKLEESRIEGLLIAGLLHDTGKIKVPAEILTRPGRLSDIEFSIIKGHPAVGHELLKGISFPWPVAEMVYQHHERLDGSGYPQGLRGDEILLESRILAIADVVEAMDSHRPYRAALGLQASLAEIEKGAGILYDSEGVHACLRLFREGRFVWENGNGLKAAQVPMPG